VCLGLVHVVVAGSEVKRSPIKKVSDKRRAIMVERSKLVARLLMERPWCECCDVTPVGVNPPRRSVDLHELVNRSQGGDILDESIIMCICRQCHSWITTHPALARELGLHMKSWEYKTNPS